MPPAVMKSGVSSDRKPPAPDGAGGSVIGSGFDLHHRNTLPTPVFP